MATDWTPNNLIFWPTLGLSHSNHTFQRSDLGCRHFIQSLQATNVCEPFVCSRDQHNLSDQGIEKFLHGRVDFGIILVAIIGGAATRNWLLKHH